MTSSSDDDRPDVPPATASPSSSAPPSSSGPPSSARRARLAVAAVFWVNGAQFANWVPRIPEVKAALALDEAALGLALLGTGAGALVGSLAAGPLITRWGSHPVARCGAVLTGALLVLPGAVAAVGAGGGTVAAVSALAGSLVALGVADAVTDVGMNAQGVVVQRRYGRSIVNGFHAWWSIGAVAGSLAGSVAAAAAVPVAAHLASAGVVLALVAAVAGRWLLPSVADRAARDPAGASTSAAAAADRRWTAGLAAPTGALGAVGALALLAGLIEDTPGSWSGVYLTDVLGADAGAAGLAFAAFTAAMTVGRLTADRVVERVGAVATVRVGGLLAAAGLTGALVVATPVAAIAGFGVAGLGMSTVFPLMFAAAGQLPDVAAGAGIGMVSLISRAGFLVGPPVIGLLAAAWGLPAALGLVVAAAVGVAAAAGVTAPADRTVSR